MSDYIVKQHDTWPPLELTLVQTTSVTDTKRYHPTKSDGTIDTTKWVKRVDLASDPPDSIKVIGKLGSPATSFNGPAQNVEVLDGAGTNGAVEGTEPGLGVPANRGQVRYPYKAGDTDQAGQGYQLEVEVTWDSVSTPPKVETFPNDSSANPTLDIDSDLG